MEVAPPPLSLLFNQWLWKVTTNNFDAQRVNKWKLLYFRLCNPLLSFVFKSFSLSLSESLSLSLFILDYACTRTHVIPVFSPACKLLVIIHVYVQSCIYKFWIVHAMYPNTRTMYSTCMISINCKKIWVVKTSMQGKYGWNVSKSITDHNVLDIEIQMEFISRTFLQMHISGPVRRRQIVKWHKISHHSM